MRYAVPVFAVLALAGSSAQAAGLLIPEDRKLPPLAMVNHKVTVAVEDQVAITTVEQTFRNHTDRALEATYLFPVPRGASCTCLASRAVTRKVTVPSPFNRGNWLPRTADSAGRPPAD